MGFRMSSVALAAAVCAAGFASSESEAGSVTVQAAEVWVLPDFNPFVTSPVDWVARESETFWVEGQPNVGDPSPFFNNFEGITTTEEYFAAGQIGCGEGYVEGESAPCSHQLFSPGTFTFTATPDDLPGNFADGIVINRTAPAGGFAAVSSTGFTFTGPDADLFGLDPAALPASVSGDRLALDLLFTGTEARDYAATLTLQTGTPGLEIPFEIAGTVTPVPTPSAAAAGVALLAGMAGRRRRRAAA